MARLALVLALLLISGCRQWYYTEKGERRLDYLDLDRHHSCSKNYWRMGDDLCK